MPGLDNLKKFNNDIASLGDEIAIRQEQGTTMPDSDIPDGVPLEDDSYDFEFGLPKLDPDGEGDSTDSDDIDTSILDAIPNESDLPEEIVPPEEIDPELAALLNDALPPSNPVVNGDAPVEEILSVEMPDELSALNMEMPDELSETSMEMPDELSEPSMEMPDELSEPSVEMPDELSEPSMELPDELSEPSMEMPDIDEDALAVDASLSDMDSDFGMEDEFSLTDSFSESDSTSTEASTAEDFDDFSSTGDELSFDDGFSGDLEGEPATSELEVDMPNFEDDAQDFVLDTGFDVDAATDMASVDEFGFGETSPEEDDFSPDADNAGDSNFEIPGFSDADAADNKTSPFGLFKKKSAKENTESERTHLTDAEYKVFKTNLQAYPLNLRLAIEQVIAKNEFTDVAVMEVLFKVVKKVSARQLATHLEKMLDISVSVPLNYERRTVEQYESYKLSLEYQLKNRIIPGAIVVLVLGAILYVLFYLTATFIYRPIKAEMLYNEGYVLIENDLYSQSEIKFNEALEYGVKKNWFFKYAQAYREKNQYDKARNMYEHLIVRFNYDKEGALEYARMEFEDLSNYERAAEITRRDILDHHINDKDAMLLLGDIFLEWATSLPAGIEKNDLFEQARLQYATLSSLYGSNDLYLSRMMRYFIRTDNLREVLPLNTYFMAAKKINLEAVDLVELGGYLLEKRYGYLPPADEYLRGNIENLRDILELGVTADSTIPEAHYNLARYFVNTSNHSQAALALNNAIATFEMAEKQSHSRTLRHIDSYRLLGELYTEQQEYLLAEKEYGDGISLFEQAQTNERLVGNENIGKLYSDMADLDYFISGDLQTALNNYLNAIENYNDTPSIRYRIGFIQYNNGNYSEALSSFVKTADEDSMNRNLLLALGNVLSIRNDDSAAYGHYDLLIDILDADRARYGILFPQVRTDHAEVVELYLKASNNLGVTLARLAERSGDSALQGQALAYFSESLRAWDTLTRNQETMVRLEGSNLAEQNIKYLMSPISTFEPAIYASIPRVLYGERMLEQSALN